MITYAEARSKIKTRNEAEAKVMSEAWDFVASNGVFRSSARNTPKQRRQKMRDEFKAALDEVWPLNKPVGNPVAVWLFWMVVRHIVWQVVLLMWGELDSKQGGV